MNSIRYREFCIKNFGKFFSKHNDENFIEKNILLTKADIRMDRKAYYSVAVMNILIGFFISFIAILGISKITSIIPIFMVILTPIIAAGAIGLFYLYLPKYRIKKRERNIDLFLPYAINYVSSMAVSGISPAEIFHSLSTMDVYGEIQKEAKKIAKDIMIMGIDSISAMKNAIETSPSKKFRSFLQGIIGTIQAGSDLYGYLTNLAEKHMQEDLNERKRDLDLLSVIGEVFVITVIAFPIFLVIILTTMGFFGGSMDFSMQILLLFSFGILPIIYAGFYLMISSTSLEEINKMKTMNSFSIKKYYSDNKRFIVLILISLGILVIFFSIVSISVFLNLIEPSMYLLFDCIFLGSLFIMGPFGIYKYIEIKKRREIQERLPEFLIEIGDSLSTGMTIFEAIKSTEKGHFGELKPEINKMKTQLSWNVSVKDVFNDFAEKMKSAIVKRVVIMLNRGLITGGNTPRIFKAAAREVNQVNMLEDQRQKNMSIYTMVIILCFFVFLAIILILDRTIFMSFIETQKTQMQQAGSLIPLNAVDPEQLKYSLFSFVFVQSIGAGVIAGFMMDGKPSSGVRISCALGLISFFVFKLLF